MNFDFLIEPWRVSNRVNLMLLVGLDSEVLEIVSRPRARSVGDQFAHLHNARLLWLSVAAPDLAEGVSKIGKGEFGSVEDLGRHLRQSAEKVESLLERGFESGKIKGYKGSPALFLGYLLAHEAHHRGQILLTLKLGGYKVPQELQYGIWEWEKV
ncbi:MAG: DinB family protein [Ignavibacteriae bacterium]|nr:DinB family protein [Ignavibacteriota bacterium]MCB9216473.1 DinB family protein [Ignavibacteria bacterium]